MRRKSFSLRLVRNILRIPSVVTLEVELNVLLLIDMEEPPPSKEDIVGVVCGGVSVDEQEDGRTGGYDGVGVACVGDGGGGTGFVWNVDRWVIPVQVGSATVLLFIRGDSAGLSGVKTFLVEFLET